MTATLETARERRLAAPETLEQRAGESRAAGAMAASVLTQAKCVAAVAIVAGALCCAQAQAQAHCPALHALARRVSQQRGYNDTTASVRGEEHTISVWWSGEPSHAAAALLLLLLRDVLRYRHVELRHFSGAFDDVKPKHFELALVPAASIDICPNDDSAVSVLKQAVAPLRPRLHARMCGRARTDPACRQLAAKRYFYSNGTELARCGFPLPGELVPLSALPEANVTRIALDEWAPGVAPSPRVVPRAELARCSREDPQSFLFLDYELWENETDVVLLRDPLARKDGNDVVAASRQVRRFVPAAHSLLRHYEPSVTHLRDLIDRRTAVAGTWEDAACAWAGADSNVDLLDTWLGRYTIEYYIFVLVCLDDPDTKHYKDVMRRVGTRAWNLTQDLGYGVGIYYYTVDCEDLEAVAQRLIKVVRSEEYYQCIGIVAPGDGLERVASLSREFMMPLVAYDMPATVAPGPAGDAGQLVRVLGEFLAARGWRRLAVLSERGAEARAVAAALQADPRLVLREITPAQENDSAEVAARALLAAGARVVFVNGGWRWARASLAAAERLNMTREHGFVWVKRAWRGGRAPAALRVFTVSFECGPVPGNAMADALLSMVLAFKQMHSEHPEDLRSRPAYEKFHQKLQALNAPGYCQPLRYNSRGTLVRARVFVTDSAGNSTYLLNEWNVDGSAAQLVGTAVDPYANDSAPDDGSIACVWLSGNSFTPSCRDDAVTAGFAALAVLSLVLLGGSWALHRRARHRRARKTIEQEWCTRDRRHRAAAILADKLVARSALDLRDEIGSGRSGRVCRAVLRVPGRPPRTVAAKALRPDAPPAEETEFLHEACTLAALDHDHVVRLVGICAAGGPPLVLMEHAFFGDLLGYLRDRRHLAEGAPAHRDPDPEAEHVSATQLTRLVREAAAALGYLVLRGLVHRDVRAANCLVDARRTLKLADFGMARETNSGGGGAEGSGEYACRRRGLFPVLWMAPESLARGAFSASSDTWALGVLALETVTLGARPYGAWPPLRVLQHVLEGGRPRLPADATAQTRGVLLACWRHEPSERPTAAELVAYLAEHPRALAPALAVLDDLDSDLDSGFCEQSAPGSPDCITGAAHTDSEGDAFWTAHSA